MPAEHTPKSRSARFIGGFLLGLFLIASSCLATVYVAVPCASMMATNLDIHLPPADVMFAVVILISVLFGWSALLAALSFSASVLVIGILMSGGVPTVLFAEAMMMTAACLAALIIIKWTDIADLGRRFRLDGEITFLVAMFASGSTVGIGEFLVPDTEMWDPAWHFAGDMAGVILLFLTGVAMLKAGRVFSPACLWLQLRR